MNLSVVIPCLNGAGTIADQLHALSRQEWTEPWEVIVADNGSTDGTWSVIECFKGMLPGLRVVDASDRRGSAHARNAGAKVARGDSIVFCDADDEVGTGWLAAIGAALSRNSFVASRTDVEKLNPPWIARNLKNAQGNGLQRVSYPPYLYHSGGSGLGIRRAVHEEVGGFDESLPRLMDTDYCFRVQMHGVELRFVPEALIHVRYSNQPGFLFRQARLWAQYNVLMYKRYGQSEKVPDPWRGYLVTWRDLLRCWPRTLHKETRASWMKTLGTQVGLLQGAIRFRVPPVR